VGFASPLGLPVPAIRTQDVVRADGSARAARLIAELLSATTGSGLPDGQTVPWVRYEAATALPKYGMVKAGKIFG
jgi:hypothetical protein